MPNSQEPVALTDAFPWARHLDDEEVRAFTAELLEALSDAADLGAREAAHRAVISWRATARITADPDQLRDALRPLCGVDLGPVEVHERARQCGAADRAGRSASSPAPCDVPGCTRTGPPTRSVPAA
jgi:hypothetical protein